MKILIYSDPHLGLTRTAHTTPKTAAKLRGQLFDSLTKAVLMEADLSICLGDLFDSYSNNEATLRQGAQALDTTDFVMAGNHDIRNSRETVSSLQFLADLFPTKVLLNAWDENEPHFVDMGGTRFIFVPHVNSQVKFEEALTEAVDIARESRKWNVLCLHCNVGREKWDLPDTTLNLSNDMTGRMLSIFHTVLVGHEHEPRDMYGGRLRIIGNLHPTSFSDISDKRVLLYDTETGEMQSVFVWKEDGAVWKGDISALPDGPHQFLDLVDDLPPGEAFKKVSRLFSAEDSPFCIRLASSQTIEQSDKRATLEEIDKLPDVIAGSIAKDHPELTALWEELYHAAISDSQ